MHASLSAVPAIVAAFLVAPARFGVMEHATPTPSLSVAADPDACSLLTEAQASAAIEVKTLAGQHTVKSSTRLCMWTDVDKPNVDNRRVELSLFPVSAFDVGKSMPPMKTEPVGGVGDDAYFSLLKTAESPILSVRKGTVAFRVRILNGLKLKPIGLDDVKQREITLAKAAVAKL